MQKFRPCFFLLLFFLGFGLARVFPVPLTPYEKSHYRFVTVKELRERMKQGQDLTLVDVRSAYAYQMEHIPGAVSVPLATFRTAIVATPLPRTGMVVTYCSCPRHEAEMAYDILKPLGYHNVFVLQEGLPGWKKLAYKTVGQLANEPLTPYWTVGYAYGPTGKPLSGVEVTALQPQTQQLEIGSTDKRGFYALKLLFYGLKPGEQMQLVIGRDVVFYSIGDRTNPWGTQVDDRNGRMEVMPKDFLKTYKKKRLL